MKTEFTITKLVLMEMPGFRDQFRHVLEGAQESMIDLRDFVKHINELGENEVTAEMVAPHAHKVLRYNALPESSLAIPFGWDDPRYSFLLEVETKTPLGSKQLVRLAGYTDRVAPIEELDFFINSTTVWHETVVTMPNDGHRIARTLISQDHLHNDLQGQAVLVTEGYSEIMRPVDVFKRLGTSEIVDMAGEQLLDLRTILSTATMRSDRNNVVPATWLSKLIEAHLSALEDENDSELKQEVWGVAEAHAMETPIHQNPVLRRLADLQDKPISNKFVFKDLEAMDREVDEKTMIVSVGETHSNLNLIYSPNYEDWETEQPEAVVAYAIAMAVPVLLNSNYMTGAHFRMLYSPNDPQAGEASMLDVSPAFADTNMEGGIDQFLTDFEVLVLPHALPVSDAVTSAKKVFLEVDADLYGSTVITVAFDDQEHTKRFVAPTFADALFSPIISREAGKTAIGFADLTLLAKDLEPLLERLEVK